jgi:hypothetical protein
MAGFARGVYGVIVGLRTQRSWLLRNIRASGSSPMFSTLLPCRIRRTKGDKVILDSMESRGEITAEQKRVALGLPPAEYANLSGSRANPEAHSDGVRSIANSPIAYTTSSNAR